MGLKWSEPTKRDELRWTIEEWLRDLWWDFDCLDRIDYIMCGLGFLMGLALVLAAYIVWLV